MHTNVTDEGVFTSESHTRNSTPNALRSASSSITRHSLGAKRSAAHHREKGRSIGSEIRPIVKYNHAESTQTQCSSEHYADLDFILTTPKHQHHTLFNRITSYTSTLNPTYLSTRSSLELRRIIRDLLSVMRHANPQHWKKGLDTSHRSIRTTFGGIHRCLKVLIERGDTIGLIEPKDFDLVFYSLARRPYLSQRTLKEGDSSLLPLMTDNVAPETSSLDNVERHGDLASTAPLVTTATATATGSESTSTSIPTSTSAPTPFTPIGSNTNTAQIDSRKPTDSLTIESLLQVLHSLSLTPTLKTLNYIAESKTVRLVPTFPQAMSRRARIGVSYKSILQQAPEKWHERLGLLESMRAVLPRFEETKQYEEEVMRTFDEADIIFSGCSQRGAGGRTVRDELELELRAWRWKLDELVRAKAEILAPHLLALDKSREGQGFIPKNPEPGAQNLSMTNGEENRAALLLLRHSLFPDTIQSRIMMPGLQQRNGARRNPLDFLRVIMGPAIVDRNGKYLLSQQPNEARRARYIGEAVVHLRNSYHVQGQFDKLLTLIQLLCTTPPPSSNLSSTPSSETSQRDSQQSLTAFTPLLTSVIHSTLLTTATDANQFRQLLLRLVHLPLPFSPPKILYTTRRLILIQARLSQDVPWPLTDPALSNLPSDMRDTLVSSGWVGFVLALFEKWGVGVAEELWKNLGNAKQEGKIEDVERIEGELKEWRRTKPLKVPGIAAAIKTPLKDPLLTRNLRKR